MSRRSFTGWVSIGAPEIPRARVLLVVEEDDVGLISWRFTTPEVPAHFDLLDKDPSLITIQTSDGSEYSGEAILVDLSGGQATFRGAGELEGFPGF